jgi:hypothetical protein
MNTTASQFVLRCIGRVLLVVALLGAPALTAAGVIVSVAIAPPALPVYVQPLVPGPGYIWTPGYWAYGPYGYYWVPGTWVLAPFVGALWTPGYWGWGNGLYIWNAGYWGPRVGFYGGVNYGFGYTGFGYYGGYWSDGAFRYNRAVNNVNVTSVHNTYYTAVSNAPARRISYHGGPGGTTVQPPAPNGAWTGAPRTPPTAIQQQHEQVASGNRTMLASVNRGRPTVAATTQPGLYDRRSAVPARGAQARSVPTDPVMRAQVAPMAPPGRGGATGAPVRGNSQALSGNAPSSPGHSGGPHGASPQGGGAPHGAASSRGGGASRGERAPH